jgi:hypothetical protein
MASNEEFKENSQAVQAHLNITQSVIQRMAANSALCKGWCIALVSAILVIVADKGKPQYTLIALVPTILFFLLDVYYLSLEKRFRESYNSFIRKLHGGKLVADDLFAVSPSKYAAKAVREALGSFSIWLFYLTLLVMIFIVKMVVVAPAPPGAQEAKPQNPVIEQGR